MTATDDDPLPAHRHPQADDDALLAEVLHRQAERARHRLESDARRTRRKGHPMTATPRDPTDTPPPILGDGWQLIDDSTAPRPCPWRIAYPAEEGTPPDAGCTADRLDGSCLCERHRRALDHARLWQAPNGRMALTAEPYDLPGEELADLVTDCDALGLRVQLSGESSTAHPAALVVAIDLDGPHSTEGGER